nr:immunoglobulin heavy chain junction region [Macaca mulatta]
CTRVKYYYDSGYYVGPFDSW